MRHLLVCLTLLLSQLTVTYAGDRDHLKLGKELNLSNDQIKKIDEIKAKYKPQIKALAAESCQYKEDLHSALASEEKGADYQAKLTEKFKKFRATHNEFKFQRFKMALEIREILNKDQISKFNAIQGYEGKKHKHHCEAGKNE